MLLRADWGGQTRALARLGTFATRLCTVPWIWKFGIVPCMIFRCRWKVWMYFRVETENHWKVFCICGLNFYFLICLTLQSFDLFPRCLLEFDEHIARQAVDVHDLATAIEGASFVIRGIGSASEMTSDHLNAIDWSFKALFKHYWIHQHPDACAYAWRRWEDIGALRLHIMEILHVTAIIDLIEPNWIDHMCASVSPNCYGGSEIAEGSPEASRDGVLCSCNSKGCYTYDCFCAYLYGRLNQQTQTTECFHHDLSISFSFCTGARAASATLSAWETGTCASSTGASTVAWTAVKGRDHTDAVMKDLSFRNEC